VTTSFAMAVRICRTPCLCSAISVSGRLLWWALDARVGPSGDSDGSRWLPYPGAVKPW
jgi:hypothetical protein